MIVIVVDIIVICMYVIIMIIIIITITIIIIIVIIVIIITNCELIGLRNTRMLRRSKPEPRSPPRAAAGARTAVQ